jgi:hypothetical protein
MKTKTQKQTPEAVLQIDEQTQNAHLSSLRARLQRVKTSPCMGELAPVLLQMLDAGQITCKQEHRHGTAEIMLAAKVTPDQIRELQSLVTHPATYGTLRYFLEGAIDIVTKETRRDTLLFSATEQFLQHPKSNPGDVCASGVEQPEWVGYAVMRAYSENALAEAIGFPLRPTADGWIHPRIGPLTLDVFPVVTSDAPLTCLDIESFVADIVVVTFPVPAPRKVHLLGWTDRDTFRSEHTRERRNGAFCCVMAQEKLFPMATLIKLARRSPLLRVE